MLTSSALVLMMTGPGPGSVLWRIGAQEKRPRHDDAELRPHGADYRALGVFSVTACRLARGTVSSAVSRTSFSEGWVRLQTPTTLPTIPAQTFMVYQLMFAIITPGLIAGAFAERMKFSAMMVFMILWSIIVYDPMAHMVWGKGGLLNASLGGRFPHFGFCRWDGGSHHFRSIRAGLRPVSGQAGRIPERTHAAAQRGSQFHRSVPAVGGMVRFQRWERLGAGSLATSAFVATHFASAAAAIGWAGAEWIRNGKPSVLGGISGAVAGLVAITPASGFVKPMPAW